MIDPGFHTNGIFALPIPTIRVALFSLLLSFCAGCALAPGSVAIYHVLDVEISGRNSDGKVWRAEPSDLKILPATANATNPFPRLQYHGKTFIWTIGAANLGIGSDIRSQLATPVCFRFDEARLTSNTQSKEIPMRITWAYFYQIATGKWTQLQTPEGQSESFVAPPICFTPVQSRLFGLHIDLSELFPNQRMFNVKWHGKDPTLLERGIGNWLRMQVPIEYEGKREDLDIKFTVKDSAGRFKVQLM